MSRIGHSLSLILLLTLTVWSCTEQTSRPETGTVPLRVHVSFEDTPGAAPNSEALVTAGGQSFRIESITARASSYDKATNRTTLQDEETEQIEPGQSRFSIVLTVPPGNYYTVALTARGRQIETEEEGVLYSGSAFLETVSMADTSVAEVVLELLVPQLSILTSGDTYQVSWTAVTGAERYQLVEREDPSGERRTFAITQTDTTLTFPPTFLGQPERQYRVLGEFEDGSRTVPSNQENVQLPPSIEPAPITDLRIVPPVFEDEMTLAWTATGDDGDEGTATLYDLRQSTDPITAGNFEDAERLSDTPTPNPAGSTETYVARNLLPNTRYHFALRAIDDADNRSTLSNVAVATTQPTSDDVTPPATVVLNATELASTSVRLNWIAPGDDGTEGTATRYELRRSLRPISDREFPDGDLIQTPVPATAGTAQSTVVTGLTPATRYYFAIRAYDEVDNASLLSGNLEILTSETTTSPSAIVDLAATAQSESVIVLIWSAPLEGSSPLAEYDVRSSTEPITADNFLDADRETANAPGESGSTESLLITDLARRTTFYFAIVTVDQSGERSPISNLASDLTPDETAPGATTDLGATVVSETSIELRWTAPGNDGTSGQAALYDLREATFLITTENFLTADPVEIDAPGPAGVIELVPRADLIPGQTYFYALMTEDASGNRSPLSNVASVSTDDKTAPGAVTDLLAVAISGSTARITWTAPGDDGQVGQASSYDLRYNTASITELNFDDSSPVPTSAPGPSGTLESLDKDGFGSDTFYFALRTADENGNVSALSNVARVEFEDTTVPNAITDLEIVTATVTSILLNWTAPGDDGTLGQAASYDLRRSESQITALNFEDALQITKIQSPSTSGTEEFLTVGDLAPFTRYYFALRSVDESGNQSAISNLVSSETLPDVPTAPSDLTVLVLSPTSLLLTWTDQSDDEEDFDVEVRVEGDLDFTHLATTPGSDNSTGTYIDTDLIDRTEYSYRVKATNVSGASEYSDTATTRTSVPDPLNLVAVAETDTLVDLSWSFPFVDPTSFEIEREEDGIWELVASVPGTDRVAVDATVQFLTSYNYRILAIDGEASDYSNIASVTTPDEAAICTIEPTSLDFGDIELGTTKVDSVRFSNPGGSVVVATAGIFGCPHFRVLSGGGSFSLLRNQSRTVIIEYGPITAGTHSCELGTGSICAQVPISGSASKAIDNFWSDEFDAHPSGVGLNGEVRSMILGGSKLIIGGAFDDAGGVTAHGVASWSGTSWIQEESKSSFLTGGPVSTVSFLEDQGSSYIIAGGDFVGTGGAPSRYAEWGMGSWYSPSTVPNGTVLATLPVGFSVWVGGLFTDIPGTSPSQHYLSRFSDDTWIEVGDFNDSVYALTLHEGAVVAGGAFTLVDGQPTDHVAIDLTEEWGELGLGFNGTVFVLASIDGILYAGGDFTTAGTGPAKGIAKWDGFNWQGIDLGIDFGVVYAIEKFGNDIVIGGGFETTNGSGDPLRRVAVYDGLTWQPLGPGIANGVVLSLRSFQGSLFAGGSFTSAGTKPSYYIARWDPPLSRR